MQIMLDTNTDKPAEIHALAVFLQELYATTPVAESHVHEGVSGDTTQAVDPGFSVLEIKPTAFQIGVEKFLNPEPWLTPTVVPPPPVMQELLASANLVQLPVAPAPFGGELPPSDVDVDVEDDSAPVLAQLVATDRIVPPPPGGFAKAYDKSGIPWDERIHMEGRQTKLDGNWKIKKKLDKDFVAAVQLELESQRRAPDSVAPLAPPPPPADIAMAPAISTSTENISAPVSVLPPAAPVAASAPPPPATAPAATASGDSEPDLPRLLGRISKNLNSGLLGKEELNKLLSRVGIPDGKLSLLVAQPAVIPVMWDLMSTAGLPR